MSMAKKDLSYLSGRCLAIFGEIAIITDRPIECIKQGDVDISHLLINVEVWDIKNTKRIASTQASLGQFRENVTNLRIVGNKLLAISPVKSFQRIE